VGQEAHVVACGAEDAIFRSTFGSGQVISFQMADARLDAARCVVASRDGC